jgi:glycosyltransferase involved in cell wall biosynthesis
MGARLSSRLPAVQISNSWAAKQAAEQSKDFFKPNHIYVVGNGVDVDKLRPRTASQPGTSLLGIGRLDPEKRWDRLLKATGVLATRRLDFCLRIAGDGLLMKELQIQAKRLGLDGRVQFLGHRPDVPELLKESLFLIHTADAEGCPNAILEAMACGRAVIATDAGDVPNLIENGRTGFVVRRGDDSTLVECIARLINDRQLCHSMGQAARVKVEREFGLGRLVANTLATYQTIGWSG